MSDMAQQVPYDIEVCRYTCPKKQTPPERSTKVQVPTLAILAQTASLLNRPEKEILNSSKMYTMEALNIVGTTQRVLGKKGNY